jgi:hypothetical protein
MWTTDTAWFDVAMVMSVFSVGSILFGRFEEHRPRWRRLLKVAIVMAAVVSLAATGLRPIAYSMIGLFAVAATVVHGWWLPRHGINGWTCEPRDKYYDLLKVPLEKRPGRGRSAAG